jgi:hypothetical protein
MSTCNEQDLDVVKKFLSQWYTGLRRKVIATTGNLMRPILSIEELLKQPLGMDLISIANAVEYEGKLDMDLSDTAFFSIQSLCEMLFAQPYSISYDIPDYFWKTAMGNLVARAELSVKGIKKGIKVQNLPDDRIKISLTQKAKNYLTSMEFSLFWKQDVSKPYWAIIPSYTGNVYLAKVDDFVDQAQLKNGQISYSLIIEIPQTSN